VAPAVAKRRSRGAKRLRCNASGVEPNPLKGGVVEQNG